MSDGARDYIAEQAVDFKNRRYFMPVDAVVHLEDAEDEMFWDSILQGIKPGNYNYIHYSKSKKGNDTHGCEQCLRYKDYLDDKFFICIDSDLRNLIGTERFSAEDYIAQTYTYSWESHYCFAERLQNVLSDACPDAAKKFDFEKFLKAYSSAVYPAFMFLLHLKRNGVAGDFEREFNARLPKQCTGAQMDNDGELFVRSLSESMTELCQNNKHWELFDLQNAKACLVGTNLTEDNAYLYVRGHNVRDIIAYIGTVICKEYQISFVNEILYSTIVSGCQDLQKVKDDLRQILK